jgi:hypothetical protein
MSDHQHQHDSGQDRRFRIPTKWVLLGFLAIGGYFFFTEHRAHVIQALPFLLLLACPLLHMFHGHGGRGGGHDHGGREKEPGGKEKP